MSLLLQDKIFQKPDEIFMGATPMPKLHSGGFWARTRIMGGYDLQTGPNGISSLGETVFDTTNMVPLGGVQYAMCRIFEAEPTINVPTLYDQLGIGLPNRFIEDFTNYQYDVPALNGDNGMKNFVYPPGHHVCLFGVGITGSAENNVTQFPVDYTENSIAMSKIMSDGTLLDGVMIPFRFTANELTEAEQTKYFGRKKHENGITGYYLKRFETEPIIRHYYATTDDAEYLDEVDNTVWTSFNPSPIDTFTELILKVNRHDVKAWATANNGLESCRINTVALFSGIYNPYGYSDVDESGKITSLPPDYQNVQMFSKLTIPTEPLQLNKDLDIIYRVYGC